MKKSFNKYTFSKFTENPWLVLGFLALAAVGLYGRSLGYAFCNDDKLFILQNIATGGFDHIKDIWHGFNTRFLAGMSFAVNYWLGGRDVLGYRLVNLAVHVVNAFCVYGLVLLTFRTPRLEGARLRARAGAIGFWAAVIFLVHPVQTESVVYVSQRITMMGALFYLGTILFYIKGRLHHQSKYFWGSVVCMAMGLLSKEMVISAPVAIWVYDRIFFPHSRAQGSKRLWVFAAYVVLMALFFVIGATDRPDSIVGLKYRVKEFDGRYFLTEINVLRTYLRLFILPVNQNTEYEYPLTQHVLDWPTLLSLYVLTTLVVVAFRQRHKRPFLSFAIVWFFITTSVEALSVCFVHGGVIFEHWLYLPMVGFAVFVPLAVFDYVRDPRKITVILLVLVTLAGVLTFRREAVWKTELTLWEDVITKGAEDYRPYAVVGLYYSRMGQSKKAMESYRKAMRFFDELKPLQKAQLLINIGALYGRQEDYLKEIEFNMAALRYYPRHPQAYSNIGYAYTLLGDLENGLAFGKKAIAIDPGFSEAYNNLGVTMVRAGDLEAGLEYFTKALELHPGYLDARHNFALAQDILIRRELEKKK